MDLKSQIKHQIKYFVTKGYINLIYPHKLRKIEKAVSKKDKIEVVFFAMNVAMWRYQGVYELLSKEERFNCHIVFTVPSTYTKDQQNRDLAQLRAFFDSRGISYLDYDVETDTGYDVKNEIHPDMLFYPQPYENVFPEMHGFGNFKDALLCYCPYGVTLTESSNNYDTKFNNIAWRMYFAFPIDLQRAKRVARNHGKNVVISGFTNVDYYCQKDTKDPWKIKDSQHRRLIWAPHFTVTGNESCVGPRSNFLWMWELMVKIADTYQDRIQIAFKPHPRLKSELYRLPDWGKERTDRYYDRWATGANTQLETGDFVDLFKSSDAMIHDSCSFIMEYLFVNKPAAFVAKNKDEFYSTQSDMEKAAFDQHYIVGNEQEVKAFIEDVVLGGTDSMLAQRTSFYNEVLRPNVKGSTSQFIVDDIKRSLGIE